MRLKGLLALALWNCVLLPRSYVNVSAALNSDIDPVPIRSQQSYVKSLSSNEVQNNARNLQGLTSAPTAAPSLAPTLAGTLAPTAATTVVKCAVGEFITKLSFTYYGTGEDWVDGLTSMTCSDGKLVPVNAGGYSDGAPFFVASVDGFCANSNIYYDSGASQLKLTQCGSGTVDGPYGSHDAVSTSVPVSNSCGVGEKGVGVETTVSPATVTAGSWLLYFNIVCGPITASPSTSAPTIAPSMAVSFAPTLAPTAATTVVRCATGEYITKLSFTYYSTGENWVDGLSSMTCSDGNLVPVNAGGYSDGTPFFVASVNGFCANSNIYYAEGMSQLKLTECVSRAVEGPYGSSTSTSSVSVNDSCGVGEKAVAVETSESPVGWLLYFNLVCGPITASPTVAPTIAPTIAVTLPPTLPPTAAPTVATPAPVVITEVPTVAPTMITLTPTSLPTRPPTSLPTSSPTMAHTLQTTTATPTRAPTETSLPTISPTSAVPTLLPTLAPTPLETASPMPTVAPSSTQPPVTSAPTSSTVASRDLELTITISDRTEATFTEDDKSKLIAATAQLAQVPSDAVKIVLSTDVTSGSTPVRRGLDTTQVLQVKESITASTVASSDFSASAANLSANSGMQITGVTVTENPAQPPSKGSNVGLIIGIIIAGVGVFGIAMSTLFWRRRKRNNRRAPPVEGRIAHDPVIEDGDKSSPTHHSTAIKH